MATQVQAQVQAAGSAAWAALFGWTDEAGGKSASVDPAALPRGTTALRLQRRETVLGLTSPWSAPVTITLADPPPPPPNAPVLETLTLPVRFTRALLRPARF